ncbi:lactate racemase domain-containing protein, partial [bacterium]|nr:lactate racemase domain-containing protein [bacterium]
MSFDDTNIEIHFGADGRLAVEIEPRQLALDFSPAAAVADTRSAIRTALTQPTEFPPLSQVVIPDDSVILAVDAITPSLQQIVAEVWDILAQAGIQPDQLRIIQAAANTPTDPRAQLPDDIRESIVWIRHDPADEDTCGYLASSTGGERIYLARELLEADVVISIGAIGFDPLLGYRGTNSVFYPALSNADAVKKSLGQGHTELEPDNSRPLRQLADEASWLLGNLFTIQTIGNTQNNFAHVMAGATEVVMRRGCEVLNDHWRAQLDHRCEVVVASIDKPNATWSDVGAALATARNLVTRGGWMIILSDLADEPDVGIKMIAAADDPDDAMKPIRLELPGDVIPATQWINAINWGRVFLLSKLNPDLVEELFCAPMQSAEEVERLLHSSSDPMAFVR